MGAVAASVMMPSCGAEPTSISHWPRPQSATTSPASLTPIWRQPGTVHLGARSQCSFIWSHWLSSQTGSPPSAGGTVMAGGVPASGVGAGTTVGSSDAVGLTVGVADTSGLVPGASDAVGSGVSAGTSVVSETYVYLFGLLGCLRDLRGRHGGRDGRLRGGHGRVRRGSRPGGTLSDWVIRSPAGSGVGVGSGAAVSPAIASSSGRRTGIRTGPDRRRAYAAF